MPGPHVQRRADAILVETQLVRCSHRQRPDVQIAVECVRIKSTRPSRCASGVICVRRQAIQSVRQVLVARFGQIDHVGYAV